MGQNFSSEPVVEKDTERDHNDQFNVAVSSCQGWRVTQEDNHSLMLSLPGEHKASFFAVYDGHGSAKVSKHASESLWRHLVENELYIKGKFKEALENSFLTFDREVNESYNAQLAGTTAVCILITDNIIYCANIGDSRAVASVNCECVPLSDDHKPENPTELKRILAAGGYVLGNRVNGNLALSRAFGDFHYKGNDQLPPEQQIVSPCPDVRMIELNDDVEFLVLACDGIWDVLSSADVVEFVTTRLESNMEPGQICEQLTTRCLAPDYELVIGCDNMTVLLVCYTRGRSWTDYCTDVFNRNSKRLGVTRTRPTTLNESSMSESWNQSTTTTTSASSESNSNQDEVRGFKGYTSDEMKSVLSNISSVLKSSFPSRDTGPELPIQDDASKTSAPGTQAGDEATESQDDLKDDQTTEKDGNNESEKEQSTVVVELSTPDDADTNVDEPENEASFDERVAAHTSLVGELLGDILDSSRPKEGDSETQVNDEDVIEISTESHDVQPEAEREEEEDAPSDQPVEEESPA